MTAEFVYEPLAGPLDDDAFRDVVFPTLNIPVARWEVLRDNVGRENLRILRSGRRVVGGGGFYRMGQWFGGRCLPSGGITIVGIAPDQRGRGGAAALMSSMLRELHAEGVPLSTLYASTQRLYRRVGYEQAGSRCYHELALSQIGAMDQPLPLHPVPVDNCEPFHEPARRRAAITNGNLERTPGLWKRVLSFPDQAVYAWVIGEVAAPEGYVIYFQKSEQPGVPLTIYVRDMLALTGDAARSLWSFLRGHRSVAGSVAWFGPAVEPLLNLTEECIVIRHGYYDHRWLLRIVDVPKALEGRGYPSDSQGELHIEVRDDLLPANNGRFVLTVADGRGAVRPGGRGDLKCDIRGLAPLYSGLFPPATLKATGQLDADDRALATARAMFAGPEPWIGEMF